MNKYYCYDKSEMILRDELATERTVLANERTLFAYLRTSINIIAAGISFIELFEVVYINILGYILLPLGVYIGVFGVKKYLNIRKRLIYLQKFATK